MFISSPTNHNALFKPVGEVHVCVFVGKEKKKKISVKESLGKAIIMITIYLNKVLCMSAGKKCTGLKLNTFLEGRVPKAVVEARWYLSGDINK